MSIYRKQAASNPAFQGDLNRTLNLNYRELGRPSEAVARSDPALSDGVRGNPPVAPLTP